MKILRRHQLLATALLLGSGSAWQAQASIKPPYTGTDGNTLLLFHLDGAAATGSDTNAGSLSPARNLYAVDLNPSTADRPVQTNILGATAFAGFGTCANFGTNADFCLGYDANGDANYDGEVSNASVDRFALSTLGIGDSSPFTLEALVNTAAQNSGKRQVICTDNTASPRSFQFCINAAGATGQQLEFALPTDGTLRSAPIPNSGIHAFAANTWYHLAVTYDGATMKFYWTKLLPTLVAANQIGSDIAISGFTGTGSNQGLLVIGGENRGTSGEGLRGLIDEVRISNVARGPGNFVFGLVDTDGDGMDDAWETNYFTNLDQGAGDNPDADGLTNLQEFNGGGLAGFSGGTNPNDNDSDDDTLLDGPEVLGSSNAYAPGSPTNPLLADSDNDKVPDALENGSLNTAFGNAPTDPNFADSDLDGSSDNEELVYQSDPNQSASVPTPNLFYFINNSRRNGSFELLGAPANLGNPAGNWDSDPDGDVLNWTVWSTMATATNDSGTEAGGATHGARRGFLQNGNAVYNLADRLVQAGDAYAVTWKQITTTGTLTVNLVFDNGGTITPLTDAVATTSAPNSNGRLAYRIPAGSPAIGKKIGVGIRGNLNWIHLDEVALSLADKDSDSDGLADLWEDQYFGNNDGNADAPELALQSGTSDADSDGLNNAGELVANTLPNDSDSDDDQLLDGEEVSGSSNAFDNTATDPLDADTDNDKLTDFQENGSLNVAFSNQPTDPHTADSDFDLAGDYEEIAYQSNPNAAESVPDPDLFFLINNSLRNGSFELLGAAPGAPSTAKASHWDTDTDGDVTYWSLWTGVSTSNNDSGTETAGSATNGTKRGYLQSGNATYNLTNSVATAGDVYAASWRHVATTGTLSVTLVYDNGGTITAIPESLSTTTAGGTTGRLVYRIPAGSPAIGKQIGLGVRSGASWIGVDEFTLNIAERDSDGDTLGDFWEDLYFGNNDGNPSPAELALQNATSDADSDGLNNAGEFTGGTLPNDNDTDNDLLFDGPEVAGTSNLYDGQATNPLDADTDDDGISDGDENGVLNTAFSNQPTDPHFADTDSDGFTDHAEILSYQTNPNDDGSTPLLFALIDKNTRNGSFELLGAEPGAPNAAKATHWDTDADGDVTYWTLWPVEATASDNSGTEVGGATNGTKKGYLQGGNAVYNLSTHLVQAGDVFNLSYDHVPSSGAVGLRGGLVYDNAGTITRITEAELTSTVLGNGKRIIYTVPPASAAIGKAIGVGFKSTGAFNGVDSVKLTIEGTDSDTDGLVDQWEIANFGNLAQNGSGDFDHDGTDNATEAALELLPADAKSRFMAFINNNGVLTWTTVPGKTFTIERSTTLQAGSWTELNDAVSGGTYIDIAPPVDRAFYRVILND